MLYTRCLRKTAFVSSALLALSALPAQALVSLNDGRDKFFVSANLSVTHDTNFYANNSELAESIVGVTLTGEYSRRAGEIGVNASAGLRMASHLDTPTENYQNPFFSAELTKGKGRTTGSLLLTAARQNDNDTAANVRTQSWAYGSELNVNYPVIERYSLSASVAYNITDYMHSPLMYDLDTFYVRTELNYSIDSRLDFLVGHRYRSDNSKGPHDYHDNEFTFGLKGQLLPKLSGTVRLGYQSREEEGGNNDRFDNFSAMAGASWIISKQTNVTAQLLKDFRTTSTDIASDVVTGSLQINRVLNPEWSAGAGVSAGRIRFLGDIGGGRTDDFTGWNAQVTWSQNEHLRATFTYSYFNNNSSVAFANYARNIFSLAVSTRW